MLTASTIIDDVSTLTRKMRAVFDKMARERGMTLARARILKTLHKAGSGATQRALADELEIEGPTLVRLLDNLEQSGWIARTAVDGDRRAKQIILTEAGRHQAQEVEAISAAFRQTIFSGLDPVEMEIARRVIAQMQKNIGAPE